MKDLILINLGGSRYGIWKDDVLSVRDVRGIHWLPMSTVLFSGIAEIEDRTANLFDLAVCLGHEPFDRKRPGRVLVMSERGKFEGFVFDSEAGRIEAAPEDVLPMPGCLGSPEVAECVYDAGEPVPVINIGLLYKRIREKRWGPSVFSFPASKARRSKSFSGAFRGFTLKGEVFAVQDEMVEAGAEEPGRIHPLPTAPPHVQGVVFKDGGVRAVINLARYMGREGSPESGLMLFASGGGGLAFGIDKDLGRLEAGVSAVPMPLVASSDFIGHALVREGEVIPLLNVHASVSRNPAKVFSRKYTPRSRFHGSFGKKEARVLEFSLTGVRHSVPDSQVEDVISAKPWREMNGIHPMLPGVAEHGGHVLPVLDLSACFGRRTKVGKGTKMVILKNGNFRALVLAEAVSGRRTLAAKEQRALPLRLPHLYVYGCYTHDNSVRLILNVEALTSHFDEKLVSEYFDMVAKEIEALEALAGGPEAGLAPAAAAPMPGAYPAGAEEGVTAPVASFGEVETIGDDTFAEAGAEEVSEFVASLGEEEREKEQQVKEDAEAETAADAAVPAASFEEASAEDTSVGPGEEEIPEAVTPSGETGQEDEAVKEETGPEAEEATPKPVASFGEAEIKGEGGEAEDETAESAVSFGGVATEGEDTFAESGEEDVPEAVASFGGTGQEGELVKEEMEPEPAEEEAPEPAASFSGAGEDDTFGKAGEEDVPDAAASATDAGRRGEPPREDAEPETAADAAAPVASFGEASGEDTLVGPGEDEVSEPAASVGDAGRGVEPAEEETGRDTGEDAAETIVSYGKTDRLEEPAEERGDSLPGQTVAEETMVDASPGTFGSLDEPGDEEEQEGESPPPSEEYLAASSEGKERPLGLYAAAVLLLLLAILVLAYFGGGGTKRAGEEVASLADTIEARKETVLPEEEVTMRGPEGEALPQESEEEIAPPDEGAAMRGPEGEALPQESEEEIAPPDEGAAMRGPEGEALPQESEEEIAEPLSGSEEVPVKPVEPMKARQGRDRRASLLMEVGPEKSEISMRVVHAAPLDAKVYEVVKGDTLWHIARRFTGNPFNYPRIARDSEIKNPDLIFPGQKVYIGIKGE